MAALSVKSRRRHRERNTFNLPQGDRIRRELKAWFKAQRRAVVSYLKTGRIATKDETGGDIPQNIPAWDSFGLGNLPMAERMTPLLESIWDDAGQAFTAKLGLDPDSWSVVNPHTQEAINQASLDFCESTNATTHLELDDALRKTREALSEGLITRGDSVADLTRRVNEIFSGAETWRARRIAASEASRATHAAQEMAAAESGVVTGWKWLLSEDACPMCVLPDTPVCPAGLVGSIETLYDGPVIRVLCEDGSRFTVTPNHLMLTTDGFIPASHLVKGDHLVCCLEADRERFADPDHHDQPTTAFEVHRSLTESGHSSFRRVPSRPKYLHGDAAFCQGDIHVVRSDRLLSDHSDTCVVEDCGEFQFASTSRDDLPFLGCGNLASTLEILGLAAGPMGRARELLALRRAEFRHSAPLSLGSVPDRHPRFDEPSPDDPVVGLVRLRECLDRLAGKVATCDIVDVDRQHYRGPVYDFETHSSLYVVGNGLTSSNCQTVARRVPAVKMGQPFAIVGDNPKYNTIKFPPLHPGCACTVVEALDIDPQPKWSQTLVDPTPEEQDYAEGEAPQPKRPKPAAVERPKPLPPKPTRKGPQGKPVGEALDVRAEGRVGRAVKDAIDAIDSIHGDGNLSRIPVEEMKKGSALGFYQHAPGDPAKPKLIAVHAKGDHLRTTAAHEIGHFLDYAGIPKASTVGGRRDYASDPVFAAWHKAVQESPEVQSLKKLPSKSSVSLPLAVGGKPVSHKVDKKYVEYLLRDEEVWARSYAQYVATRGKSLDMKAEIQFEIDRNKISPYHEQWDHESFKPIAAAMDEMFKKLGWMR